MGRGRRFVALAAFGLFALLAGCGFHLRGAVALPDSMQRTYLQGIQPDSALAAEVRAVLEGSGGQVVNRVSEATAILRLEAERTDRRIASVDSSGKVREYILRYSLPFTLLNGDGEVVMPRRTVQTTRSYNFDPGNVLGAGSEEAVLVREMRGFAVRQMLRQVRMAAAQEPTPGGEAATGEGAH